MSDTDSFIDEVTEEVRRDRLFGLMKRYGWIGIAAVVAIVGGSAGYEWNKARNDAAAQSYGDAVLAAMSADDAARAADLAAISASTAGQIAVRDLLQASELVRENDRAGAVALLLGIAAQSELPPSMRDLAELKAATIAGPDEMTVEARKAIFDRLAVPGNGYRALAMEGQALALLAAGDEEAAIGILNQILQEPNVTAGLRRRAGEVLVTLGADVPT
jgi:hypothetical protein